MVRLTVLTGALASIPLLLAHPHADIIVGRDEHGGCETRPTEAFLAAAAAFAGKSDFSAKSLRAVEAGDPTYDIKVKTWFHVVAASKALEDGYLPEDQLAAQLDVMNENFAPQRISLQLMGTTRTINEVWATDANYTGASELEMKKALRKGDYKTLNIYFQKTLWNNALGYAYYPADVKPKSDDFYLDGASIKFDTVPGGAIANYNEGKTATHEVGHWFGLAHTFEGDSCTGPGDYVSDTPIMNEATRGCPIGKDTCPDTEGPDPIHNYMDYSYDSCYEEFTPWQTKRAFDFWNVYRKKDCSADNCLRSLRAPKYLEASKEFCGEFTQTFVSDVSVTPKYAASACKGDVISKLSSACNCLVTPTLPVR